jgi:hypothetical protein
MAEEKPREEWLYLGQRQPSLTSKPIHVFRDASGQDMIFQKAPKGAIPGCWYSVQVSRTAEGVSFFPTTARFLRQHQDIEERQRMFADHSATVTAARARNIAADNQLDDMTLEQIRQRMRMLPTPQRRALLAVVLERLGV